MTIRTAPSSVLIFFLRRLWLPVLLFAAFIVLCAVTAKAMNPKLRIITRAGQQRYAQAMRNSGADEVIIPEHEGGLMVGRMIEKYSVV